MDHGLTPMHCAACYLELPTGRDVPTGFGTGLGTGRDGMPFFRPEEFGTGRGTGRDEIPSRIAYPVPSRSGRVS